VPNSDAEKEGKEGGEGRGEEEKEGGEGEKEAGGYAHSSSSSTTKRASRIRTEEFNEASPGGVANTTNKFTEDDSPDEAAEGYLNPPQDQEEEEEVIRVSGKRRKALEDSHNPVKVRRRKLREWYSFEKSGFSPPTAMMMMNLVWGKMGSHVPLDAVWQAILGVTDQYQRSHINADEYDDMCEQLKILLGDHLTTASERIRYTARGEGEEEVVVSGFEAGQIQSVTEFRFFLYRHWSLFEAMYHSPYIASKIPVWQAQGTVKLKELLAKTGVPLYQCNQVYTSMAPLLRDHFRVQILKDDLKTEYNLQTPGITYNSFFRYNSFKNAVGASDVVYAATSLLEMFRSEDYNSSESKEVNPDGSIAASVERESAIGGVIRQVAFNEAYDCLGIHAKSLLEKGIASALAVQRIIVKRAAVMLEAHESIVRLNRLYFAYVRQTNSKASDSAPGYIAENEMDAPFSRPMVLQRLGHFIIEVKRNLPKGQGRWAGRKGLLPLILIAEKRDTFLVVGISPLLCSQGAGDLSAKDHHAIKIITNFRQYFKLAAKEIKSKPLKECKSLIYSIVYSFYSSINENQFIHLFATN
jgi:cell division control protein 45